MANSKAAKHRAIIHWEKLPDKSETYTWSFENGVVIHNANQATMAQQGMIDPESAFVASLTSCHMLSFLAIAAKRGFAVKCYHDEAVGVLEMNSEGRIAVTRILLRPKVAFIGDVHPTESELDELHQITHQNCFIANSVKTAVHIEPVMEYEATP